MMTLLDTSILNFSKRALQVFGLVLRVGGWIGILYSGLDLQNSNKRLSLPSYNNTIWSNDDNLYGSSHVPFIQHASLHLFQLSSAAISLTQSSFLHTRQEGQPAGTRVWNQIIIYFFRPPETNALLVLVSLFTNETLRGWRRGDRPFQDKTEQVLSSHRRAICSNLPYRSSQKPKQVRDKDRTDQTVCEYYGNYRTRGRSYVDRPRWFSKRQVKRYHVRLFCPFMLHAYLLHLCWLGFARWRVRCSVAFYSALAYYSSWHG